MCSEKKLYYFSLLKFIENCFTMQHVIYSGECSSCTSEECIFAVARLYLFLSLPLLHVFLFGTFIIPRWFSVIVLISLFTFPHFFNSLNIRFSYRLNFCSSVCAGVYVCFVCFVGCTHNIEKTFTVA